MRIQFESFARHNWEDALKLSVHEAQKAFVPTVAESLAAAYIKPWDEALDPYVIYVDDRLVGCFYVSYTPDSQDNYWIGGFMIDREFQGRGYGCASLKEILRFIPKVHPRCREVKLTVEKGNEIAQKLYRSLGFDDTGETNKYDEIIYVLPVTRDSPA